MPDTHSKNPLFPGLGIADPHIRVYNDRAYLYATHDKSPQSARFIMEDWWIWSTPDLIHWNLESTLRPEETYYGKPDSSCWAVDSLARNGKYYLYFSRGPREIGVVAADSPVGPWKDVTHQPLIADGLVPTEARDPGLLLDDDGEAYIVFGTWDYYIARLAEDMVSLAEAPRKITIHHPEGPYGKGKTDDKPYLHKRQGIYYLSWGCYYGMSTHIYGPYDCKGSVLSSETVSPTLQYKSKGLTYDRHGSFFEWRGRWFYICNDMSQTDTEFFRDCSLGYVHYNADGRMAPVTLNEAGVVLPPRSI